MIPSFDFSREPLPRRLVATLTELATALGDGGFLVIGAQARFLIADVATGTDARVTHDLDIAIAVPDWTAFRSRLQPFARRPGGRHAISVLGVDVDVLPYGAIESMGVVHFDDDHDLSVVGLAEAAQQPTLVTLPGGARVRVASLPALAALKILAWRDRSAAGQTKDARDLATVLSAARLPPYVDLVWNERTALERHDHHIDLAAAHVVGQRAGELFAGDGGRGGVVLSVIAADDRRRRLARDMGRGPLNARLLDAMHAGFQRALRMRG